MNAAVIFAGGSGTRMKSRGLPKQFLEAHGKAIITYTLEHFDNHPAIDAVVVVCIREYIDYLKKLIAKAGLTKVKWIVPGGASPLASQYIGLKKLEEELPKEERHVVLLHDGVRPLIDEDCITRCIESVKQYGNAITMSPAIETIITVDEENNVQNTYPRKDCRLGRAPQCFYLDEILSVHERAMADGVRDRADLFIDSATMMQHYGFSLHAVEGPASNIKITTATDYYVFKALIDAKENSQIFGIE